MENSTVLEINQHGPHSIAISTLGTNRNYQTNFQPHWVVCKTLEPNLKQIKSQGGDTILVCINLTNLIINQIINHNSKE